MPGPGDEEEVPKLPRGRGLKLSGPEIFRIIMFAAMLVAIIALAGPCGRAVSGFVMRFDNNGSGSAVQKPMTAPPKGVMIRGDMTDDERKQAIERARSEASGSAKIEGSGSGKIEGSGSGSN